LAFVKKETVLRVEHSTTNLAADTAKTKLKDALKGDLKDILENALEKSANLAAHCSEERCGLCMCM